MPDTGTSWCWRAGSRRGSASAIRWRRDRELAGRRCDDRAPPRGRRAGRAAALAAAVRRPGRGQPGRRAGPDRQRHGAGRTAGLPAGRVLG